MSTANCYPGQEGTDTYAVGGLKVALTPADLDSIFQKGGGGFGWGGTVTIRCTCNASHPESPNLTVTSWTTTAIVAELPVEAPCSEECEAWQVNVSPSAGQPFVAEPVSIRGLPDSGYPPIRG